MVAEDDDRLVYGVPVVLASVTSQTFWPLVVAVSSPGEVRVPATQTSHALTSNSAIGSDAAV
jgi:hypothetical protein